MENKLKDTLIVILSCGFLLLLASQLEFCKSIKMPEGGKYHPDSLSKQATKDIPSDTIKMPYVRR